MTSCAPPSAASDHPVGAPLLFDRLPVLLALDLGSSTGWALRGADGAITSGVQEFRPNRFEGGGMPFLRFNHWLSELNEAAGPIGAVFFEEVRAHRGTLAAQILRRLPRAPRRLGRVPGRAVRGRPRRNDQALRNRQRECREGGGHRWRSSSPHGI
jgi:hypothetical protein